MLSPTPLPKTNSAPDLHTQLQRSRIFSSLNDSQIDQLLKQTSIRSLPEKSPIGLIPADASEIHYLVTGRAKVCYHTDDGKQPILYFVGSDELIGEQSILHGSSTQEAAETIESCLIASIPTRSLRSLVLHEPAFAMAVFELIARRRKISERRIRQTMFLSNRERLSHLLLDLAEQFGSGVPEQLDLTLKLSHQDLANYIGSTRETVTVVLGKMQEEGLLAIRRRRITLKNGRQLAHEVQRDLDW